MGNSSCEVSAACFDTDTRVFNHLLGLVDDPRLPTRSLSFGVLKSLATAGPGVGGYLIRG